MTKSEVREFETLVVSTDISIMKSDAKLSFVCTTYGKAKPTVKKIQKVVSVIFFFAPGVSRIFDALVVLLDSLCPSPEINS